ncbi:MAG: NADH oxidase, partial [Myxococcota bacterium]
MTETPRQLFTTVTEDERLVLSVEPLSVPEPADDEVVVRIEAAPINPSDLGLLLAPVDMDTVRRETIDGSPALVGDLRPGMARMSASRMGKKLPAGNEGAGTVVAAGASDQAQALRGKTVTLVGGMMYRTHRVMKVRDVIPLPEGATAAEGASLFVNPMTVQGFLNTMRREGHTDLVHTAAASNLGQMLAKLCLKEEVPLVAIVRKDEQRALLAELGLTHIVDSSQASFMSDLVE